MRKRFEIFSLVNYYERKIIDKYERFLARTHCFYKAPGEDTESMDNMDITQVIIICMMKLCAFISLIRCVLWPTPFIKYWTCNAYHYLGNALMINLALCCATMAADFGNGICFTGYSLVNRSCFMIYLDNFKNKKLVYLLNERFRRKLFRRLNLFANLLNAIYIPTLINWSCLICGPIIIGYFDREVQFSIIGEIRYVQASLTSTFLRGVYPAPKKIRKTLIKLN